MEKDVREPLTEMVNLESVSNEPSVGERNAASRAPRGGSESHDTPSRDEPGCIVGIGTSAGGLEALEAFFDAMPQKSGMAFVVIQHSSPDFISMLNDVLTKHTSMAIRSVEDGMKVQPDTIYMLPPRLEVVIANGRLHLTEKDPSQELNLPIDQFFRSLAQDAGRKAAAIILSGSGSDGSRGIRDIHEAGGLVMAQSEEPAKADGMPRSAMETGIVDLVLQPGAMPKALLEHMSLTQENLSSDGSAPEFGASSTVSAISQLLEQSFSIDFSKYKPGALERHIGKRIATGGHSDLGAYISHLRMNQDELNALYHDLLIGVTQFFRTPGAFEYLERHVIPAILASASSEGGIRVWVAGCATGEEAYSLAILFREQLERMEHPPKVKIFATDVHRTSLDIASAGIYGEAAIKHLSQRRLDTYFTKTGADYRILPELRQMIVFTEHDIIKSPPFTKMDLISCRNLLAYLKPEPQKKALSLFHFALKAKGLLFLGPSETLGELDEEFEPVERHWRIFSKRRTRLSGQGRLQRGSAISGSQVAMSNLVAQAHPYLRLGRIYDILLSKHMPPSVLVNERHEVVHVFGDAGNFFRLQGRVSIDILQMVEGDARFALGMALKRAAKEEAAVSCKSVRMTGPRGEQEVDIIVEPIRDSGTKETFFHLQIVPHAASTAAATEEIQVRIDEEYSNHVSQLEQDLQHTRESLQAAIEVLEASNEELQTSNQDLIASNEELYSVNEKLSSVNEEYEKKIADLQQLSRDKDNLLKHTEIGTIFLDTDLRIRKFTPSATSSFNLQPQDIGRPIDHIASRLVEDDDLLHNARLVLDSGEPSQKEVRNIDGRWLLRRILQYRTETGVVEGVLLLFFDISKLKEAEGAYRQSEEKFRIIFEQAGLGVGLVDRSGRIVEANRALEDILGYSRSELQGLPIVAVTHPDDVAKSMRGYNEIREGKRYSYQLDKRYIKKDGSWIWGRLVLSRITDPASDAHLAVAIVENISERKRAELDVLSAKQWAEASSCAKTELLASLSYEIRTPISGIVGMTDMLQERVSGAEEREYLDMIRSASTALLATANDILDFSKLRERMIPLDTVDFDFRKLLDNVVTSFAQAAREKTIHLKHRMATDIPSMLTGDPGRLTQVLNTLLSNAVQFTTQGSVEIEARRIDMKDGHVVLELSVRDPGTGIPQIDLGRLFNRFPQGEGVTPRKYDNASLSLTMAKELVEMMEGTMSVDSEPGKGSVISFSVRLKVAKSASRSRSAKVRGQSNPLAIIQPLRILLAEDNQLNRTFMARVLTSAGHDVVYASNGQEVLKLVKEKAFDMILMDIHMPYMDGIQATEAIRRDESRQIRTTPIVALTAFAMKNDREQLMAVGIDGYVPKPIDLNILAQTIAEVLDKQGANSSAQAGK